MPRHMAASVLLAVGLYFSLLLVYAACSRTPIAESIEHSRRVLSDFQASTRFVDAFRAARRRLPSGEEFDVWSRDNVRSGSPMIVSPDDASFGEEAVAVLGRPPAGRYLLGLWRGEWMEYYAPWSGRSTLSFDEGDYYMSGSQVLDMLLGGLLAFLSMGGAYRIWMGRRTGTASARNGSTADVL